MGVHQCVGFSRNLHGNNEVEFKRNFHWFIGTKYERLGQTVYMVFIVDTTDDLSLDGSSDESFSFLWVHEDDIDHYCVKIQNG